MAETRDLVESVTYDLLCVNCFPIHILLRRVRLCQFTNVLTRPSSIRTAQSTRLVWFERLMYLSLAASDSMIFSGGFKEVRYSGLLEWLIRMAGK